MVQKIIIRSVNWLGDAIMSLPTLQAIRRGYPEASISLLVKSSLAPLFDGHPSLNDLMILPAGTYSWLCPLSPFQRQLNKKAFDLALILPNSFQSALIFFLARVKERVGYATSCRQFLLSNAVTIQEANLRRHQVYYYTDLLKSLNLNLDRVQPQLHLSDVEKDLGTDLLRILGIRTKNKALLIGFNPGASYGPAKRWPPERYAELARQLNITYKAEILLFGTEEDLAIASKVESLSDGKAINLAGKLDLRDFIRLMAQCALIVSNDSGGTHLAAALNVPLLVIFGSTNPFRTGPLSSKQRIIYKQTHCSPCLKRECPTDFSCMNNIQVSEVLQVASELLDTAGR